MEGEGVGGNEGGEVGGRIRYGTPLKSIFGGEREMQDRCQEGGDFVERKLEKRVTSDGGKMRLRTEIRHRDVR